MSNEPIDVLATIRRHAESHRALAVSDAYSAQEASRLEAALAAVDDMIKAASAFRLGERHDDEVESLSDYFERRYEEGVRLDAALARIGASA